MDIFVPGGGDGQQWRGRQPWGRHHQRNQPCTCRSHCQRQEQQRLRHTWWILSFKIWRDLNTPNDFRKVSMLPQIAQPFILYCGQEANLSKAGSSTTYSFPYLVSMLKSLHLNFLWKVHYSLAQGTYLSLVTLVSINTTTIYGLGVLHVHDHMR